MTKAGWEFAEPLVFFPMNMRDIRQRLGLTILFITHELRVASQICGRIAVMHKGRIVETGTVEAFARCLPESSITV